MCNLGRKKLEYFCEWMRCSEVGVDKPCLLIISSSEMGVYWKDFELTITSFKMWAYRYYLHQITTLLAALSAGTKTNDLHNSFNWWLILKTDRFFDWLGVKVNSKCVIQKSIMLINLVIELLKDLLSALSLINDVLQWSRLITLTVITPTVITPTVISPTLITPTLINTLTMHPGRYHHILSNRNSKQL